MIVRKELSIHGFIVLNWLPQYEAKFYEEFSPLVKSGEIKSEADVVYGLDKVGEALLEVANGTNRAKKIVVVANE